MPEFDLVRNKFNEAKSARVNWDEHWQDIANLVMPTRSFIVERVAGEKVRHKIMNETAPQAAISLAGAVHGLLLNPSIRWMQIASQRFDDNLDEESMDWLYDVSTRIMAYLGTTRSGHATSSYESAEDLVAFGTSVTLCRDRPTGLSFQARRLANMYLVEDDEGHLIELFREFDMPARLVVEMFGKENCSEKTNDLAKEPKRANTRVDLLHHIWKRSDRDPTRRDKLNKPWGSIYFEVKEKHELEQGGMDDNPYIIARWSKSAEEVYGRSPAMSVMPAIREVNARSFTNMQAGELAVAPPVWVPARSVEGSFRTTPFAVNYGRPGSRDKPEAIITGADPSLGENMIIRREESIEKAFFLDKFKLPDNDRMTATEIIARRQESLLTASPILSRLYAEWLNPIVTKTFNWLRRRRLIPPAPLQMSGKPLRIDYISPLALSQKASEVQSLQQALNALATLQGDVRVLENLDVDAITRGTFSDLNVNPAFLLPSREVAAARQQRQQLEQAGAEVQVAQGVAAAAKDAAAASRDVNAA